VGDDRWTLVDVKYNSWHHFNPIWHTPTAVPHLVTLLKGRGAVLIHIGRRDLLARHVSEQIAIARGAFHFPQGEAPPPIQIDLDPKQVIDALRRAQSLVGHCSAWFQRYRPRIDLVYEKLFREGRIDAAIGKRLGDLLGIATTSSSFPLTLEKAVRSPSEHVRNWGELVAAVELARRQGILR